MSDPYTEPSSSGRTAVATETEAPRSAASRLFDIRLLIGGLFTLYGVMLIVGSFFTSTSKSAGIDINLWLGIGMLVVGLLFLLWRRLSPLRVEPNPTDDRTDLR